MDDEPIIRDALAEFLAQEGFQVVACNSGEEALARAEERRFDAALCDMQLPGMDGLQLLERLRRISPDTFVLLITAYATVENTVQAFHRGAHDYLMKPIILDEVSAKIRRLRIHRELFLENQWLRRELNRTNERDRMIGDSPAMRGLFAMIRKLAPTRSTVLIVGESGTGKELVARAIHAGTPVGQTATPVGRHVASSAGAGMSPRRFIAINCSAIPHDLLENQLFGHRKGAFTGADRDSAGVFVHAAAGTVFLDEVAEMPLATQAKLLRAIEQKEILPVGANEPVRVEARVLAATNKDLMREVEAGRFREDLYYRLNVVIRRVPPLREHREDIPALVEYLLAKHAADAGQTRPRRDSRGDAVTDGVPLARQRPRAGQRLAAGRDSRRRPAHHAGRPAARPRARRGRPDTCGRPGRGHPALREAAHRADPKADSRQKRGRPASRHRAELAVSIH